ncbi:MAG: nitroreductase family protein [Saccharofermentans sp.]|jgi:nitroreductase|nr:nitroreductase family protein [Mageeibacillus sp.]MCI1264349.1 nitroreductase family protein [Saccharofermentans sp.]MCI1275242.1 nitroreductase family protein [Saccharofermentans sp.]
MDFIELARARFSCRSFLPKPVEDEKIEKLLEAARIAPTGKNNQPQRIYILKSEDALAKINSLTTCIFGAPMVLLFAYDTRRDAENALEAGIRTGVQDCAIVATHVMLEAQELGLNTCWVCRFPNTKTEETFMLPEYERAVLLMPVGYKDPERGVPSPRHETYKDNVEMVQLL